MKMLDKDTVKSYALASGFKLKEQPDGSIDLNPYVYDFAELLAHHCRGAYENGSPFNKYRLSDLKIEQVLGDFLQLKPPHLSGAIIEVSLGIPLDLSELQDFTAWIRNQEGLPGLLQRRLQKSPEFYSSMLKLLYEEFQDERE